MYFEINMMYEYNYIVLNSTYPRDGLSCYSIFSFQLVNSWSSAGSSSAALLFRVNLSLIVFMAGSWFDRHLHALQSSITKEFPKSIVQRDLQLLFSTEVQESQKLRRDLYEAVWTLPFETINLVYEFSLQGSDSFCKRLQRQTSLQTFHHQPCNWSCAVK